MSNRLPLVINSSGDVAELPSGDFLTGVSVNGIALVYHTDGTQTAYTTLTAAKTAAVSGETIIVGPGTYNEKNLAKNGVNWYFEAGAVVNYSGTSNGAIWDDSSQGANGAVTFTVSGFGDFKNTSNVDGSTSSFVVNQAVIRCSNVNSVMTIVGRLISSSATHSSAITVNDEPIRHEDGILSVTLDSLVTTLAASAGAYRWLNGQGYLRCTQINTAGGYTIWGVVTATPTGQLYVNVERIISLNYCVQNDCTSSGATARCWVIAKQIEQTNSSLNTPTVNNTGGLLYVIAEKIKGPIGVSGGTLYVKAQKSTALANTPNYVQTGGIAFIDIDHCDDSDATSAPSALFKSTGGTTYLSGKLFTRATAGDAIWAAGGIFYAGEAVISTQGGSNDLERTTGTLNVLPNLGYSTAKTSGTLTYPTAQNVLNAIESLSQTQGFILAGPASGGAGVSAFRALVAGDLPATVALLNAVAAFTKTLSSGVSAPSNVSGTITPDSTAGNVFNIPILTAAVIIANPSGTPVDGQIIKMRITQDGTGGWAITWGSQYQFGTDITSAMIPTTASSKYMIGFEWVSADSKWRCNGLVRGYV